MKKLTNTYLNICCVRTVALICMVCVIPFGRMFWISASVACLMHIAGLFLEKAMTYYEEKYLEPLERLEDAGKQKVAAQKKAA